MFSDTQAIEMQGYYRQKWNWWGMSNGFKNDPYGRNSDNRMCMSFALKIFHCDKIRGE